MKSMKLKNRKIRKSTKPKAAFFKRSMKLVRLSQTDQEKEGEKFTDLKNDKREHHYISYRY